MKALPCVLALLLAAGCRHPKPDGFDPRARGPGQDLPASAFEGLSAAWTITPEMRQPSVAPYRLGVGDILEIEITGVEGTRAETFVLPDGMVYFDLAGGVKAEGYTVRELARRLENELARDYARPVVGVSLREVRSRRVWVLGRVEQPGLYPLRQPTTVLEAVSMAGGLASSRFSGSTEELANLHGAFLLRGGRPLPIDFEALLRQGDLTNNVYLEDGDYLFIPSTLSQRVTILGDVMQPQSLGHQRGLTLLGAIAQARGFAPRAKSSGVLLVRGSLSQPKVAEIDVNAILSGEAPDVLLEPFDLVWVPRSGWSRADDYLRTLVDAAARTIAVNEGARAVPVEDASRPSVVIPLGSGTP